MFIAIVTAFDPQDSKYSPLHHGHEDHVRSSS